MNVHFPVYPDLRIVAIVEPNVVVNLITSGSFTKCQNAVSVYEVLRHLWGLFHSSPSFSPSHQLE